MVQLPIEKRMDIPVLVWSPMSSCWEEGKEAGCIFQCPTAKNTQPIGFSSALHHAITTCYYRLVTSDRLMYSRTPSLFVFSPSSFGIYSHPTIKYSLRHCILVCFSKSFILNYCIVTLELHVCKSFGL